MKITDLKKISAYGNVSEVLAEGQKDYRMRDEPEDHPANTMAIPAEVTLYTGEVRSVAKGDRGRYVAFFEQGGEVAVVDSDATRAKLKGNLVFSRIYSSFAPSAWYRNYRSLFGFPQGSHELQSDEQRLNTFRKGAAILCIMAGADPGKAKEVGMFPEKAG